MMSNAFARACREACRRFHGEYRAWRMVADVGPRGIEKLRKRLPYADENATYAKSRCM